MEIPTKKGGFLVVSFIFCIKKVYYTYLKRKDSRFGKRQAKIQFPAFISISAAKPWQRTKRLPTTRVGRSEDEKSSHFCGFGVTTVYREGLVLFCASFERVSVSFLKN